jgi:hypothetical protein
VTMNVFQQEGNWSRAKVMCVDRGEELILEIEDNNLDYMMMKL